MMIMMMMTMMMIMMMMTMMLLRRSGAALLTSPHNVHHNTNCVDESSTTSSLTIDVPCPHLHRLSHGTVGFALRWSAARRGVSGTPKCPKARTTAMHSAALVLVRQREHAPPDSALPCPAHMPWVPSVVCIQNIHRVCGVG